MTALEYAEYVLATRDLIFERISNALPVECEKENRFIQTGVQSEDQWMGTLENKQTKKIRMFVLRFKDLSPSDLAKTAGAANINPQVKLAFELFHDYELGTDDENSEQFFNKDALCIQFAIETNRGLSNKATIENYSFPLGLRPSEARPLHYGRGEMTIRFRDIRY